MQSLVIGRELHQIRKTKRGAVGDGDCIGYSNYRLSITNKTSGLNFQVDTGANISVLPVSACRGRCRDYCEYKLYASEINTYQDYERLSKVEGLIETW